MLKNNNKPLAIALHGMDNRTIKMMALYLEGPCGGIARIGISPEIPDVDMFDGDLPASKVLLEKHVQGNRVNPVIVLALTDLELDGVLLIKKPIVKENMLNVLAQAKKLLKAELSKKEAQPLKLDILGRSDDKKESKTIDFNTDRVETIACEPSIKAEDNKIFTKQPNGEDQFQQLDDWFTSGL